MNEGTAWTDAELARLRLEGLERLVRMQGGSATDRDAAELLAWRGSSRAHEEAFRSAVELQGLVRTVFAEIEATGRAPDNVIPFAASARRGVSRRHVLAGAVAASVAGVLVVGRSLDMVPDPAVLRADFRTAAGERRRVALPDGATVDLNTRTSIALRHDLGMPAIELIDGEAILASKAGGSAALVAGKGTSIARSGRFNARRERDEVCISCLAGTVAVDWDGETHPLGLSDEVRYDNRGIGAVKRGVDAAVITAWQSGTLIFQDMPMRTVVAEINRYRRGKVFMANDRLAARLLTGTYHVDRLDDFFSQAELALGAKVTRLPGDVVILS